MRKMTQTIAPRCACASVAAILLLPASVFAGGADAAGAREVLPTDISPVSYDLSIAPDSVSLTFRARVRIEVEAKKEAPAVVLNADKLTFDRAVLDGGDELAAVTLDQELQRATLTFSHPIAPGSHVLTIDYHGTIGRSTLGFFAMDYRGPPGKNRVLATNFEPASERQIMPSWDEPGLKAAFTVSADIPAELTAVSNMPVASSETLPGGLKRVHFQKSPRMSTYLLFLGIGDFERISTQVDGVDVGVVVTKGNAAKGQYALSQAARILHYYNGYFGYAFPLPKLDLIASPGEISGGSMENWGAIFYSQKHLLFDPAYSTEDDRQYVFEVVAHEMSHQWFGDLVTMAWWDNLWLNEGFASWMQTKAADVLHPEWRTGLKALRYRQYGMEDDAKPSTHPVVEQVLTASQAEQAFDDITYEKGSAVVGMLEAYVGPHAFRDGVRRYMKAHAFGNTVDSDLWQLVQAASGKPILEIEADFTTQPGVPLLRVMSEAAAGDGTAVDVAVGRFAEDPATLVGKPESSWHIPVSVLAGDTLSKELISGRSAVLTVAGGPPALLNAGQTTYARVVYPADVFSRLLLLVPKMDPADQLDLIFDSWALGQSGYAPVSNLLALANALPQDADPVVWGRVIATFRDIDALYGDDAERGAFRAFARGRLGPLAASLGWDARPGEDVNVSSLRMTLLNSLSRFDDAAVIKEANRLYSTGSFASPAVRRTVVAIVSEHADAATLDRLVAAIRSTPDPLQRQDGFEALMQIEDPVLAPRVLDLAIGPDSPAGSSVHLVVQAANAHPDLVWDFALKHMGQPELPLDSMTRLWAMPAIAGRSLRPARVGELQRYADANIPASARDNVIAAITTIEQTNRFRADKLPEINRWLASQSSP